MSEKPNTGSAIRWLVIDQEWSSTHWIINPNQSYRRTACGLPVPIITNHSRIRGVHELKDLRLIDCEKCLARSVDGKPNTDNDWVLGIVRDTIRNAPKMPDQTHWQVPGIGNFDLEGNFLGEETPA